MELIENLPEVLVGLGCDDEIDGPESPSVMEVLLLSSELVVTMADGARKTGATTPEVCCTASGNKPPMKDEVEGADMEMGGMNDLDTTGAEVTGG